MAIDWTNYKTLSRADKAALINRFDRDMEVTARGACGDDVIAANGVVVAVWIALVRTLNLSAAEIAEAIMLCETFSPYVDFDGKGPYGSGATDRVGNDIIDRAMSMASQWSDSGYPDCFCTHDIGYTKFGTVERLRDVATAGRCPESVIAHLEAGATAAKAACDVLTFMVMTEGNARTADPAAA
jgi:hypothetical protein